MFTNKELNLLIPTTGVEPVCFSASDFESDMYSNSIKSAYGAPDQTRTGTVLHQWILSPHRLPIPTQGH